MFLVFCRKLTFLAKFTQLHTCCILFVLKMSLKLNQNLADYSLIIAWTGVRARQTMQLTGAVCSWKTVCRRLYSSVLIFTQGVKLIMLLLLLLRMMMMMMMMMMLFFFCLLSASCILTSETVSAVLTLEVFFFCSVAITIKLAFCDIISPFDF